MVKLSAVYEHIDKFIKEDKQMKDVMQFFLDEYGIDMFESVKALASMCVNGDISRNNLKQENAELRGQLLSLYKSMSTDFAKAVNITLDHLKKFYGKEDVLKGEIHYKMSDALATADKILGRTKTKDEEETF